MMTNATAGYGEMDAAHATSDWTDEDWLEYDKAMAEEIARFDEEMMNDLTLDYADVEPPF